MAEFDYYVGIDWSGARGPFQAGIAVFMAEAGGGVPICVQPPEQRYWSRENIQDWLLDLSQSNRVLAGIDFAFAYPVSDLEGRQCGYFPDFEPKIETVTALWQLIDQVNADQPHLYGGGIWDHPDLGAHYNAPAGRRGSKFTSRRRRTEKRARAIKSPSPTFNCVGPAGVGTGSLAGMRLLHHLNDRASIWPFQKAMCVKSNLTLVEIFPSYYFALAGMPAIKGVHATTSNLNKVLAYFGSEQLPEDFKAGGPDFDEADALISAAALRALARDPDIWLVEEIALQEGWIFGVK